MTEEDVAAWVLTDATAAELLAVLPEQHALYDGRSAVETTRLRGFVLAAFERTGLPDEALPYVLEELESGRHAYLVAAAARALRGGRRDPSFVAYLRKAETAIRNLDVPVTFAVYKPRWPIPNPTSAVAEIRKTLEWIGDEGDDCCNITFSPSRTRRTIDPNIALEDQDGRTIRFGDFFHGKLSVVAFFYTRCDNPEKCSLTITKLARVQQAIDNGPLRGRVRIAAITYDPAYDQANRIKRFGTNRGIRFDDDTRFFRTPPEGFDDLRANFDLGVNYAGSLVNRHRLELYILNARGETVATFTRMQWEVDAVVAELLAQLAPPRPSLLSALPAVAIALLPKCPLCLGAYLSAFGLGGLQMLFRSWWTVPLTLTLLALHIWVVHRRSRQLRDITPLALSLVGATMLIAGFAFRPLAVGGAVALGVGAMLSAWPRRGEAATTTTALRAPAHSLRRRGVG